jgi:hypothetical protein
MLGNVAEISSATRKMAQRVGPKHAETRYCYSNYDSWVRGAQFQAVFDADFAAILYLAAPYAGFIDAEAPSTMCDRDAHICRLSDVHVGRNS